MNSRFLLIPVLTGLFTVGAIGFIQPVFTQEKNPASQPKDAPLPPLPSNCQPLPLVGGDGSEITKSASIPGVRIPLPGPAPSVGLRNNWNTDWFVPSGRLFKKYRVTFMPHDNSEYSLNATLKYPDESIDQFYREQGRQFTANKPVILETTPRSDLQPFQVNTNIGGLQAIGARYTVAAAGCL